MLSRSSLSFPLQARHPGLAVKTRDTFDIPHLNYEELEAGRKAVASHTPEERAAFALASELTDEVGVAVCSQGRSESPKGGRNLSSLLALTVVWCHPIPTGRQRPAHRHRHAHV